MNNNPELIVAIPSYMEADSIAYVVRQVDKGIARYYKNYNSVIVNVDNNSEDNTKAVFLNTGTATEKKYITTPKGVRGKGNNFYNLFKFANKHISTLKAVVVVDADLKSITPEWVVHLADPILKNNYEYAVPRYSRHQFDGTITNHICYPLLYGLLGEDMRQPIGGEFSFSPEFVKYCLKNKWSPTTRQYGIDIFMTFSAIKGKFRICEAGLGAKIHKASAPKLGPMFTQVVTTLFDELLSIKPEWINKPLLRPEPKPLFGLKKFDPPQELKIDIRNLKQQLRDEYLARKKLLKHYLNDYSITLLQKMFDTDYYMMDTLMWTQVLYQLLFVYDKGTGAIRKEIIEALKPLYFTRSVTFDYQSWRYNINYAEEVILEQAKAFASQKPYLIGLYSMDTKKGRFK
ncbi:MAG: glycosyltransferase [Spirochaetes bacterium]|nr:glycosyltransferase [Spirochaetota bacterium]